VVLAPTSCALAAWPLCVRFLFVAPQSRLVCIIRAMPISDSVSCRSVIPFHADR
jgi:hypothetical protein